MPAAPPLLPEISDDDVNWVSVLMRLDALDAPRLAFLTARHTLDVSACPGSGKTTLIVAKLAMLARNWPHRTKGICVLSHTNVAREEVQRRLGSTVVGHRLLNYPHFIDTIHGFVNRFAALPWLRSNGYPSPTIDDEVATAHRRSILSYKEHVALSYFLEQKHSRFEQIRICARDLAFDLGGKPFPAGANTSTFNAARKAVTGSAQAGYFCHDEMFVWARALLADSPNAVRWLRRRFPLVLVDEMQDTTAVQSELLNKFFPRDSAETVVQRVGDPNQAIYELERDDSPAEFPAPSPTPHLSIPNSYRFGPEIAALASPFAVTAVGTQGLCGHGPKATAGTSVKCPHTVFVFADDSTAGILDAYGRLVLESFDDPTLRKADVVAVGAVHRDEPSIQPGHAHYPKSVSHYWIGYAAEISRKDPHPRTLIQYARAAQLAARDRGDLSPGVDRISLGLLRLACRIGNAGRLKGRSRTHTILVHALQPDQTALATYRRLIKKLLVESAPLTEEEWSTMRVDSLAVAEALCEGTIDRGAADAFLDYVVGSPSPPTSTREPRANAAPNCYRVRVGERHVDIRLGSIHSVKGQTHLATLLLNTYWHAHSSRQMAPWLQGEKVNRSSAGQQDRKRLLQTYVAMTRPSHLLCIAVRRSAFGEGQTFDQHAQKVSQRGWQVLEVVSGTPDSPT